MKIFLMIILFFCVYISSVSGQVVVIANKDVPADTIKRTEVLDFYALDIKTWSDGSSVVVFDLKPKDGAKKLFYDFLGKSSSRMKSIWMKKLLSGEGNPPKALKTQEEMLQTVTTTPGAIGFVDKNMAGDAVKILLVIEK